MATFRIPVRRDVFDYTIEPEGLGVTMRFNYNARMESWIMDVPGEVEGIRVVGGVDLLGKFKHKNVPQGRLYIYDLDKKNREPTKANFGDRIILLYDEP